jgi:glycine cleavage system aminomethyltransferase T
VITSSAASARLGRTVALAMVKHAHAVPGTRFTVAGREAEVVEVPLAIARREG